eukprot:7134467-Prymnesium_polylepis.1
MLQAPRASVSPLSFCRTRCPLETKSKCKSCGSSLRGAFERSPLFVRALKARRSPHRAWPAPLSIGSLLTHPDHSMAVCPPTSHPA